MNILVEGSPDLLVLRRESGCKKEGDEKEHRDRDSRRENPGNPHRWISLPNSE
jgi:hypothetical protein